MSRVNIEMAEYASDLLAQAAYVSNGVGNPTSVTDDNCSSLATWTNTDSGSGVTSQETFDSKSCFKQIVPNPGSHAIISKDVGTVPNYFNFQFGIYLDTMGGDMMTQGDGFWLMLYIGSDYRLWLFCGVDAGVLGLYYYTDNWYKVATLVLDTWYDIKVIANVTMDKADFYINNIKVANQIAFLLSSSGEVDGKIKIQTDYVSAASLIYLDYIKLGTADNFQSYSESTIKTQGSYSLKGIAAITDSLNKTLTHAVNPVSNADIDDEDMVDISDWTDADSGTGVSSQVTFDSKSCMKLDSGTAGSGTAARRTQDIGTFGTRTVVSFNLYCDAIGTSANNDYLYLGVDNATVRLSLNFRSDGIFIYDGAAYNEVGTDLVVQDTWQEWTFDINWTAKTVDVYLDQVLKASGMSCAYDGTFTNGTCTYTQYGTTTANRISYIDWFKAGSDFVSIDLSGLSKIKFDMRASRTGSNIKIGLYNSSEVIIVQDTGTEDYNYQGNDGLIETRNAAKIVLIEATKITGYAFKLGTSMGSPSGDITVRIETNSGSFPSGTLANANLTKAITPIQNSWNTVTFTTPAILEAGTYWAKFNCDNQLAAVFWRLLADNSSPSQIGAYYTDTWHTWIGTIPTQILYGKKIIEITPNILSANTFQEVIVPLQNVINANKNAIDSIIITIINADAGNIFYIDNLFADYISQVIAIG